MEPVSDQTRIAVWHALCDLERNVRYYSALADRFQKRQRWLRFAILTSILVEAGVVYFAMTNPWASYLALALGALVVALTVWDALSDYPGDAATLRVTGFICNDLSRETEALWRSIEAYGITTQDAEARLQSLLDRWAKATQQVRTETDHRLNRQTTADANKEIANRYAL